MDSTEEGAVPPTSAGLREKPPDNIVPGRMVVASTLVSGHGLKHLYHSALTVVLPEIKAGLGLSNTAVGALFTVESILGGAVNIPAGFAADRYSNYRAQILTVALILIGAGYLLAGSFPNYWIIMITLVLAGIGTSMWHPSAIASMSSLFPSRRGFALSMHGSGGNVGEVTGPLIAGALLLVLSWERLFQLSMIPIVVAAVLTWIMIRGMKVERAVSNVGNYIAATKQLFRNRTLLAVLTLSGTRSLSHHTVAIFIPIYLREDLEYTTFVVGLYASLLQLAGIFTQPLMGLLSDRFSRKTILVPSMVAFGLLCTALVFADPGWQLTLVVAAIGAFIFSLHSIFVATSMDLTTHTVHGTTVALTYSSSFAVGAIGPVIGGVLADAYGVKATFLFAGAVVVATALLLAALRVPKPQTAPAA